jgi:hypothetical protein
MQPCPPADLALRQTLDEVQSTDLGPLLHPDHLRPPELALRRRAQAPKPPDDTPEWPTFQPAHVDQSPGADKRNGSDQRACAMEVALLAR